MNSNSIISNYDEAIIAVKIDGNQLKFVNEELKDNFDLCYAAINQNFSSIRFCSNRLKSNKDIALLAISKSNFTSHDDVDGSIIYNSIIAESLRADLDFIFNAFISNPNCIHPPDYLLNDIFFMYQAVSRNGMLIRFASLEIKHNRQIVLAAAKQDGDFFCDSEFQIFWDDREIVLAAVSSSWDFLTCISDEYKSDDEFIDMIISNCKNLRKLFVIPNEILFSKRGILECTRFKKCFLSLSSTANRFTLLLNLLNHNFLTKELIIQLKVESIQCEIKMDVFNLFTKYCKNQGIYDFE